MSQCSYNGTGQAGRTITPCIGSTVSSNTVNAGQYIVVNVVRGFRYTFTVIEAFNNRDERLNIFDMSDVAVGAFNFGAGGTSVAWTATFNGQIKVLLTRDCGAGGQTGQPISTVVNSVGNIDDSQTTFGTDSWVGHVYDWAGTDPPGGSASPSSPPTTTPFSNAEYVGYYTIPTESFNEGFGGDYACFPVTSAGAIRNNIYAETFAVRYRMRSTKTGCYLINFRGDDGMRLYVDNVLVFDRWVTQPPTSCSNVLVYLNGSSNIVFEYYENFINNIAEFSMTPFLASTNTVTPTTANVCSGVSPGVLDGSAYTYNGGTANPSIAYQWQSSTDNVTFTNISGATNEDYTPPTQTTTTSNIVLYYRRTVRATASGASSCVFKSGSVMVTTAVGGSISLSSAAVTNTQTRCINSPLTNITYTTTNAIGATFSGLPAGVSGTWSSNTVTISGAPTAAGTFNYTVTLTGSCNVVTASGTITVSGGTAPVVPALTNQVVCNAATNAATPLVLTGTVCGVVDEYQSLTLTAPQSTVFTAVNFASYGTPTGACGSLAIGSCHATNSTSVVSTAALNRNTVTIAANNGTFGDPCVGTFKKLGVVLAYSNTAATYTWTNNTPSIGLAASGTGNVPSFIAVNNTAAPIVATISVTGTQGSCGSAVSTYTITVNPTNTVTLTSAAATTTQTVCVSTPITSTTYATTGATGATFAGLPGGVTGNWASNVATISGSPTVAGTFNYTVTLTSGCGAVSAAGSIVASAATIGGSVAGGTTICNGGTSGLLTLSGHTGSVIRWESSTDGFTTSTPIANTTTTYTSGVLTQNTQFRAVVQNENCAIVNSAAATVTVGGVSTWNGTSWDIVPTIDRSAIFAGNYNSAAALQVCSCTVNTTRNVTVLSGGSMTVQDFVNVVGTGTLTFENNAPLVQINNAAVNTGVVRINRNSSALMRLDYTLWSSPVAAQNLLSFSPFTFNIGPSNIRFYTYSTASNFYSAINNVGFTNFAIGKGYLIRMPNNHPTTPTVWNGVFNGVPNDGIISAPISYVSTTQIYNTIGNPYASPINLSSFVAANTANINGTIRFWRKTNTSNTGYSTWNGGIFVAGPNFNTSGNPGNVLQTGQGFMVEAKAGATAVVFNNSMRVLNYANQFFKSSNSGQNTAETPELDYVWLNLLGTTEQKAQMAVGYRAEASNDVDGFDALAFNDSQMALSSIINDKGYTIESRAQLSGAITDVIPLQLRTPSNSTYVIELDHSTGFLQNPDTKIYLKDKANSLLIDLRQSGYSFSAAAGSFKDRFELQINTKGAQNELAQSTGLAVYKDTTNIVLNSGSSTMVRVTVYDLLGRLYYENTNVNASELRFPGSRSNEVLIIKATFSTGEQVVKKVLN